MVRAVAWGLVCRRADGKTQHSGARYPTQTLEPRSAAPLTNLAAWAPQVGLAPRADDGGLVTRSVDGSTQHLDVAHPAPAGKMCL